MNLVFSSVIAHMNTTMYFFISWDTRLTDEEYMWTIMAEYIHTNVIGINVVAGDYLQQKGQTFDDYVDIIKVPGHKGDELSVYLLACMTSVGRHIRHHSPPRYQCKQCGKQFHQKYVLEAHTNVHSKKGYACTYPKYDRIYKPLAEYQRHLKRHRAPRQPSTCHECGKSFKEKK